jgi:hypothetical protein
VPTRGGQAARHNSERTPKPPNPRGLMLAFSLPCPGPPEPLFRLTSMSAVAAGPAIALSTTAGSSGV